MSYQISLADVWAGLIQSGDTSGAVELRQQAEALLTTFAKRLAARAGFEAGEASMDHPEFAGLLIPVYAATEGQPIPECIAHRDDADEWQTFAEWNRFVFGECA